jgi:hypothetical protein
MDREVPDGEAVVLDVSQLQTLLRKSLNIGIDPDPRKPRALNRPGRGRVAAVHSEGLSETSDNYILRMQARIPHEHSAAWPLARSRPPRSEARGEMGSVLPY